MKLHERGLAMSKILIVEDEESIADIEKDYLELNGYEVEVCNDGTSGLAAALHEDIDMCILDIMLPGTDGFEICKQVREVKDIPIIMVSAKKEDIDKIRGLGLGADDYMTKPFGIMELISRVKALLRRANVSGGSHIYSFDGITMDDAKHQVLVDGQETELTYKEYQLLKMLIQNSGIVLQRSQILDRVWGIDYEGESRTLDMHIKTLRRKIGEKGSLIQTVRNVGYTMNYRKDK